MVHPQIALLLMLMKEKGSSLNVKKYKDILFGELSRNCTTKIMRILLIYPARMLSSSSSYQNYALSLVTIHFSNVTTVICNVRRTVHSINSRGEQLFKYVFNFL